MVLPLASPIIKDLRIKRYRPSSEIYPTNDCIDDNEDVAVNNSNANKRLFETATGTFDRGSQIFLENYATKELTTTIKSCA